MQDFFQKLTMCGGSTDIYVEAKDGLKTKYPLLHPFCNGKYRFVANTEKCHSVLVSPFFYCKNKSDLTEKVIESEKCGANFKDNVL